MLTSSANQYLRPEYLTPLPTTLDAKKSPLALLAQTCSQIGVDPPTSKSSLLTPPDKSSKPSKSSESSSREKASPTALSNPASSSSFSSSSSSESSKLSSFKPYESCVTRDKASSPEQQRVPSVHSSSGGNSRSRTPGNGKRCSSNQSASSSSGRAVTPQAGRKSATPGHEPAPRESPGARLAASDLSSPRSASANSPALQPSKPAYSPAQAGFSSQELSLGSFRPATMSMAPNSSGATTMTTPSAAAYGLPYPPQLSGLDPLMASSLMSQHQAALKSGLAAHPYLSYARMKTPTGADALVPVCRDPYCSGCQLNSHLLAATSTASAVGKAPGGACPAGCVQCDHKSQAAVSPYAAYAHAQLVALAAASQMPYACNWIAGDAGYCGKRFSSSDELLQHFRGHTGGQLSPADQHAAATAAATTAAALSLAGLGAGHPLFSRSYPTPPLSPLAAARYHPYSKPYGGPPLSSLGLPLPPPPHPAAAGLPPYFSPYSLYAGSRLGAASGMHP